MWLKAEWHSYAQIKGISVGSITEFLEDHYGITGLQAGTDGNPCPECEHEALRINSHNSYFHCFACGFRKYGTELRKIVTGPYPVLDSDGFRDLLKTYLSCGLGTIPRLMLCYFWSRSKPSQLASWTGVERLLIDLKISNPTYLKYNRLLVSEGYIEVRAFPGHSNTIILRPSILEPKKGENRNDQN